MAKVLIIDDVKFTSIHLTNILNSLNSEVLEVFSNMDESLDFYKDNEQLVEIVFLSLNIPLSKKLENSIELIKQLKLLNNDIKIVMITPIGEKQRISKAIQYGATGFIEKPIKPEDVKKILNQLNIN